MPGLEVTLQKGEWIEGSDIGVTGWNLTILFNDLTPYEPEEDILVEVELTVLNQPTIFHIAQQRKYSEIEQGSPARLPLSGTLWMIGKPEETILQEYTVNIYYVGRRK